VFLGIGVGLARQLEIPGEELEGVVDAIEFIYNLRSKTFNQIPVGDKVVVIGLGMTAIDAATQAKRLGRKRSDHSLQENAGRNALHTGGTGSCQTGWLHHIYGWRRLKK
jgi:NADPH-dependent glutamate synthase beta subunit-like oxidoreductase